MRRINKEKELRRSSCSRVAMMILIVVLKVVEITVVFIMVQKTPCITLGNSTATAANFSNVLYTITDLCAATGKVCTLCPLNWVAFVGKCYYFSEDRNNWSSSRQHCEERNADMLSMEDMEEQEFISKYISLKSGHFWIGLTREGSNWFWKTGGKLQDHISITSSEQKCATFGREMSPESCSNLNKWICEKNISRYLT